MRGLLKHTAEVFALAGGAVACTVALMTVFSIAGRAWWAAPIPGDVEITQMGIALAISLCLPWCQLRGANIIVDFFTQGLGARRQGVLDGLGCVLLACMCALLSWRTAAGALAVREAGETSMILGLPMWWAYAALAPGLALTALVAGVQAVGHWRGQRFGVEGEHAT